MTLSIYKMRQVDFFFTRNTILPEIRTGSERKIHSGRSDKNTENALREILPTLDKVINANPIYIYILHPVKSKQT